jgi:hypothetical protein
MNSRTKRTRALVAGAALAGALATGIGAAAAQTPGTLPHPDIELAFGPVHPTVRSGESFVVRGNGCRDVHRTPGVVHVRLTSEGGPVVDAEALAPPRGQDWELTIATPAGLAPGRYPLVARCDATAAWSGKGFEYTNRWIDVEAAAPAPAPETRPGPRAPKAVPAKPRFTG